MCVLVCTVSVWVCWCVLVYVCMHGWVNWDVCWNRCVHGCVHGCVSNEYAHVCGIACTYSLWCDQGYVCSMHSIN